MTTSAVDAGSALLIQRCVTCRLWTHPETERCPHCEGTLLAEPVSGDGTVFTFTVNHHAFQPKLPVSRIIAVVELAEQADLRMVTNIIDCQPEEVSVGMPVRAVFEHRNDSPVPVFRKR